MSRYTQSMGGGSYHSAEVQSAYSPALANRTAKHWDQGKTLKTSNVTLILQIPKCFINIENSRTEYLSSLLSHCRVPFYWVILGFHSTESFWGSILLNHFGAPFCWVIVGFHSAKSFWGSILLSHFGGCILLSHFAAQFCWVISGFHSAESLWGYILLQNNVADSLSVMVIHEGNGNAFPFVLISLGKGMNLSVSPPTMSTE